MRKDEGNIWRKRSKSWGRGEKIGQRTVEEKVRGMCFWEETRRVATWGYWLKSWNIKGKKIFKGGSEEVLLNPVWQNTCGCVSHSVMSDSLHGLEPTKLLCPQILQARILESVAISFSKGSSWPRDRTWVSCIEGRFFNLSYREIPIEHMGSKMPLV